MAIIGSQIIADVVVRGATSAEAQLVGVGAASDSADQKLAALAIGGAAIATGALIAVGAISLKMAADFQQGVNRLRTGAGDTQDSFASLSRGILHVSTATGVLTPALTQAMYLILSSGQRGALAFSTLAAAAKGAQIEQASVVDVANVLSGLMTNYGTRLFGATQYMNGLIKAVSLGKITLQQLAVAMGPIDPIAKSVGVSFSDLSAAMTTQTNAMIPAERAATGLRFMMLALENPTKKARDAMAAMGLSSLDVANEMKVSLPGALQMIYDAAKRAGPEGSVPFDRAVSDMVGGIRSFTAYTALTGPHMADFVKNANAIAAAMRSGTGDVNGWAIAQSNLNVQAEKARAGLDAMFITIGTDLLPMASAFLKNVVVPAITSFSEWSTNTGGLHDAFQELFAIMGGVITDTVAIIKFFGEAGPQGTILKDVLVGIGLAMAAVKVTEFGASLAVLANVTIPAFLVKMGLMTTATVAGGTAAAGAATGTAALTASMTAALGPLALAAAAITGVTLAAKQYNETLAQSGNIIAQQNTQNPLNVFGGQTAFNKIAAQNTKDAAAAAAAAYRDLQAQINKAWADAQSLAQWFLDHHRIPGFDPVNITTADAKVLVLKSHLDDVAMPTIIGVLTPSVLAARQKVIDLKAHLDDLTKPEVPQIGLLTVNAAILKVMSLKAHLDDLQVPVVPSIGLRSINDAIVQVMNLKAHLDDLPNRNVYVNVISTVSGGVGGFAEGGPVLRTGLALVHAGEYVIPASNAGALPGLATRMGSAGAPVIHVHPPDIILDGVRLSRGLLPHIVNAIRYNVSSGFGR